jgi:Subtilase family
LSPFATPALPVVIEQLLNEWINDRELTYQQWDDFRIQREDEFDRFVQEYQGELIDNKDGETIGHCELSDSFSYRISISGKGLRDIVLNFPYVFDVSLPDDVGDDSPAETQLEELEISFTLEPPSQNSPKVCVIDSGIQEKHPLLESAIAANDSRSWVPDETELSADFVKNGGHGTRVAGAVLYPNLIPTTGQQQAVCWLQNARVLDKDCRLSKSLFPPTLISNIVKFYQGERGTRIFNHSIAGSTPCRTQYMSAWAAEIDNLSWQHDILFIVAAGNLPIDNSLGNSRRSIRDRLQQGKTYPDYLLSDSCRVPNPAQSFQALTVGSVSLQTFRDLSRQSIAQQDYPSAFSCTGLGMWDSIKPEVVEYGGDLVSDGGTQPNLTYPPEVCPDLVRSTLNGGPMSAQDCIGTSYAAPKVAHIAACLAAELPNESCLLYRALIVQSARFPSWVETTNFDLYHAIRLLGYGIPNLDRALGNSNNRITLIAKGERRIAARQAQIYEVSLPDGLRSPGEDLDIRIEVTLSYKAQPRRTRRARRKYLSTWLDWECSKKGEVPERFLDRVLKEYDAPAEAEESESIFNWVLNKRKNWGQARKVSRQEGTLQKDWAIVKSYDLRESFCVAVVGHEGWNNDPNATVPYALVVSFEAVDTNIPIYTSIATVQVSNQKVPNQVETEISIES